MLRSFSRRAGRLWAVWPPTAQRSLAAIDARLVLAVPCLTACAIASAAHGDRRLRRNGLPVPRPILFKHASCAGFDDDATSRNLPAVAASVFGAITLASLIVLGRRSKQSSGALPKSSGGGEDHIRESLAAFQKRLSSAPSDSAAELLQDASAKAAIAAVGLVRAGRAEIAALAALASVMSPASPRAAVPPFNEAVVVCFASLDADRDERLSEEEWRGFYSAAQALGLLQDSPPESCLDASGWHDRHASRLYSEMSDASGLSLSDFGAWCRRKVDRSAVFRWYGK